MNPVLLLTHNNLELTKRCVDSVLTQDAGNIQLLIFDNGSVDGTVDWIRSQSLNIWYTLNAANVGVSFGWNDGLGHFFGTDPIYRPYPPPASQVLVIGNDTVLAPWFYRHLLSFDVPFVTGVAVDNMEQLIEPTGTPTLSEHPDFSAFLIRRDCWEAVGPFDERMKHYASDCDFHVRAQRKGIILQKACVPYYHERSSTLRLASPEERCEIESQANKDRAVFRSIYNCSPGEPAYEAMFLNPVV